MQDSQNTQQILIENQNNKQHLERIAWLLDSAIPLPGGFRLGLDSLIGLIPVVGDVFSALLSMYIIGMGVRQGASKLLIIKMISNVLIDTSIGMVPVFGDLFDIANRANYRNVTLLRDYFDQPIQAKRASLFWLIVVIIGLIGLLIFLICLSIAIIRVLIGLF